MFISNNSSVEVHLGGNILSGISVSSYVSVTYFI